MIYWINGSYGVGKTTIAECLVKELKKAYIFDPEAVGNAVRDNHPEELIFSYIFEDYELWRKFNYELLKDISNKYVTIPELAIKIGKSEPTIHRHIDALVSKGIVKRVGSRKTGYWEIK